MAMYLLRPMARVYTYNQVFHVMMKNVVFYVMMEISGKIVESNWTGGDHAIRITNFVILENGI